jgi:hypothetical protein
MMIGIGIPISQSSAERMMNPRVEVGVVIRSGQK